MIVTKKPIRVCKAGKAGLYVKLLEFSDSVLGKPRLGVLAYADAILQIPKTLARNAGFDSQDAVLKVVDAQKAGKNVGLDIKTGEVIDVFAAGIIDQYRVKYQLIHSATTISSQMLLVDEILRAGRAMTGGAEQEQDME